MRAAQRWADDLAAWTIPDVILAAAPESPFGFPPQLWGHGDEGELTPTHRWALEALPDGGTVLDVGAGGGAASLPLRQRAGHVTAVDESDAMLARFAEGAREHAVPFATVQGRWPDVAAEVPPADVVVCAHVLYNVPDIAPFVQALTDHARQRVVVELHHRHPWTTTAELWQRFHGLDRPDGPTVEDALDVLRELGLDPQVDRWTRALRPVADRSEYVAYVRRRVCVGPDRDVEIDAWLGDEVRLSPALTATLWWPGAADA
jgi:SAM-dependent methyltransferase